MEYVKIFEFTAAVRGYHYKRFWKPEPQQVLNCCHEKNNAFGRFAIMVCETPVGHLPMEISRVTRFFIDRGGSITAELTSDHYIRSPFIQGGIEIPCKVTANISGTVINLLIMEKSTQLVQELYTEQKDEDILDSFLQAEATGINAVVRVPRDVPEPKKKKNKYEVQTKDIRNFLMETIIKEPTRIDRIKRKL